VDPEKGLSDEGKKAVGRIAQVAKDYEVNVSGIHHSGKKRAAQTAEIFAASLNPSDGVQEMEGLKALDDVTKLDVDAGKNVMLVGHLPFMEKLTSYLITGDAERPPVLKFQNGGIVCLDLDPETDAWFVKWTLLPQIGQ
jgi:phosphohistidine phosphatase